MSPVTASASPPRIDVSELPTTAFGHRAPLWWGVAGLLAIEGTVFALCAATYFYLRGSQPVWPPPGDRPLVGLATIQLAILLASILPMHLMERASVRRSLRGMRFWLIVCTLMGLVFLVLRGLEIAWLGFRWDSHAYGSIFWTTLGIHTIHGLTSTGENLLFIALLFIGPVEEKHLLDVQLNGVYWYFVVLAWVPMYVILYLDPGVIG